ncbi:hypothetical protein NDU88_000833 [Pleurodeles waltl]|uniref:Uncharacterized protein n=1 Tax=Pleurodeles waltl TaxID=8319 RepID=A0AAV7Q3Y5_PLEWA|nr:hypothetical protein NDU88_000833 [Pleurodeles waltl]
MWYRSFHPGNREAKKRHLPIVTSRSDCDVINRMPNRLGQRTSRFTPSLLLLASPPPPGLSQAHAPFFRCSVPRRLGACLSLPRAHRIQSRALLASGRARARRPSRCARAPRLSSGQLSSTPRSCFLSSPMALPFFNEHDRPAAAWSQEPSNSFDSSWTTLNNLWSSRQAASGGFTSEGTGPPTAHTDATRQPRENGAAPSKEVLCIRRAQDDVEQEDISPLPNQ